MKKLDKQFVVFIRLACRTGPQASSAKQTYSSRIPFGGAYPNKIAQGKMKVFVHRVDQQLLPDSFAPLCDRSGSSSALLKEKIKEAVQGILPSLATKEAFL